MAYPRTIPQSRHLILKTVTAVIGMNLRNISVGKIVILIFSTAVYCLQLVTAAMCIIKHDPDSGHWIDLTLASSTFIYFGVICYLILYKNCPFTGELFADDLATSCLKHPIVDIAALLVLAVFAWGCYIYNETKRGLSSDICSLYFVVTQIIYTTFWFSITFFFVCTLLCSVDCSFHRTYNRVRTEDEVHTPPQQSNATP